MEYLFQLFIKKRMDINHIFQPFYIYYSDERIFGWLDESPESYYQSLGTGVEYLSTKLIMTNRMPQFGCQDIVAYYFYWEGEKCYLCRQKLSVFFQLAEFNLIFLASRGGGSFLPESGEKLTLTNMDSYLSYYEVTQSLMIPRRDEKYEAVVIDIKDNHNIMDFRLSRIMLTYDSMQLKKISILPKISFYLFRYEEKTDHLVLNGTLFCQGKEIIGMVSYIDESYYYVLPKRIIDVCLNIVFNSLVKYQIFHGWSSFPVTDLDLEKGFVITKKISTHSSRKFLPGDIITEINNSKIFVIDNEILVEDLFLREAIPLEMYLKLNCCPMDYINVNIRRGNKIKTLQIVCKTDGWINFLSSQTYLQPGSVCPYVNFQGIIIVKLTYELIYFLSLRQIFLSSYAVDKFLNQQPLPCFIVIDSSRSELPHFPQTDREVEYLVPVIVKIGKSAPMDLADVQSLMDVSTTLTYQYNPGMQKKIKLSNGD